MRNTIVPAMLFFGCQGGTDTGEPTSDTGAAADYVGLSFLLESADGYDPLPDVDVRLSIQESSGGGLLLRLGPGCNGMDAEVTLSSDGVVTVSMFSMTEMGCDTALMDQEVWFVDFLMASPKLSYEAPRLTLTGSAATLVFLDTEVATPDLDLAGPTWTIDSYIDADSVSAVNLDAHPTLLFDGEGGLDFSDSCNSGVGSYSVDGDTLSLADFAITDLACEDEMVIEASNHFHAVISAGETTFEIDASRITLMRGAMGLSGTGA